MLLAAWYSIKGINIRKMLFVDTEAPPKSSNVTCSLSWNGTPAISFSNCSGSIPNTESSYVLPVILSVYPSKEDNWAYDLPTKKGINPSRISSYVTSDPVILLPFVPESPQKPAI